MIYTIYHVPYRFAPLYHFAPYHFAPWKWFNDLHYLPMSRIILPPALDFVFILIKSPLQQKLMTGAHPVTVAPLVVFLSSAALPDISVNFYAIALKFGLSIVLDGKNRSFKFQ